MGRGEHAGGCHAPKRVANLEKDHADGVYPLHTEGTLNVLVDGLRVHPGTHEGEETEAKHGAEGRCGGHEVAQRVAVHSLRAQALSVDPLAAAAAEGCAPVFHGELREVRAVRAAELGGWRDARTPALVVSFDGS